MMSYFLNLFAFNSLTILPSIMIVVLGMVAVIYNHIFTKHLLRSAVICLAVLFSVIAILSINLLVVFIAIETLSGLCFVLILLSAKVKRRVAINYFLVHALAGVLMMIAIVMNFADTGSFDIKKASSILASPKEIIMLISLIINVAAFPFLNWYTKTYMGTDSFSLIILSAITTKTSFFILWKIIPGGNILFEIGFITLIVAMFLALMTSNIIKFLLLTSIASMGFSIMAISYNGFLITEGISLAINFQLIWYVASSVFAIGGFLVLYGFITNAECHNNSFTSIKNYFQESGSSVHFVIPSIVFGLCIASFPFTASFIAKTNITKFFVHDKLLYVVLKSSSVAFIMFAIKLVMPVCYSVEFFKLDTKGKRLAGILYCFVAIVMAINISFALLSDLKYTFFTISVEVFTFIAYTCVAGVLVIILDFMLKAVNAKHFIEVVIYDLNFFRRKFLLGIKKLKSFSVTLSDFMSDLKKVRSPVLELSKVTPSIMISVFVLILLFLFLINLIN